MSKQHVSLESTPDSAEGDGSPKARSQSLSQGFAALTHRNYRLFFTGQLISVTGTWMQSLAQAWLVIDRLNASAFQLGLVNVCQFGPVLLLGIPAGVIADKLQKRSILITTQIIFSMLAAILALLVFTNRAELWHVYLLAGIFGVTNAFDMPTRQAFVSEMVPKDVLMNAIALNAAMFNTGRILGPAVAGIILAAFGPAACFAINAVTYLGVIIGLLMMKVKSVVAKKAGSAVEQLKLGLQCVHNTPAIRRPVILVAFVGTFGMCYNVWLPLLATDSFNADAGIYGLLFSSMGLGSLIGALSVAFFGKRPSRVRMLSAAIGLGVVEILLALVASVPLHVGFGMLLLALSGFAASNTMAIANSIVQTTAPDELRGRVMAVYSTVFMGSVPIGAILAGAISDRYDVTTSMFLGGAVVAIVAVILSRTQRDRKASAPSLAHSSGHD